MSMRQAWLAWESLALAGVCLADLASTLYLVHQGQATELNPLMAYWLHQSDFMFCVMKLMSFLPLLTVCAYYRPYRPRLVAYALRLTIVLYIFFYVGVQVAQAAGLG